MKFNNEKFRPLMRAACVAVMLALAIFAIGCGGSNGSTGGGTSAGGNSITSTSAANVVAITVDNGPPAAGGYLNGVFTTVTVCVPGTTNCETIDHVLVDTGSEGLRLLHSASGGEFNLGLPGAVDTNGQPLAECNQFVDGNTWGAVRLADVKVGSESASNVHVQVVGDLSFNGVPDACAAGGTEDTISTFAANAILGVGLFLQDCGPYCQTNMPSPPLYYACPSGTAACSGTTAGVTSQVQNPASLFATDNNGVIVELPPVPSSGTGTPLNGSLVFGIGTQSNNSLGTATVLNVDGCGNFATNYNGQTYYTGPSANSCSNAVGSYIDSGSNAFYFLDPTAFNPNIPTCPTTGPLGNNATGFYCPASTQNFTVTNASAPGTNNGSKQAQFSIANADNLVNNNPNAFAFSNIGGPSGTGSPGTPSSAASGFFDFGLPFFYGRNIYTAFEQRTTPAGGGPFFAY